MGVRGGVGAAFVTALFLGACARSAPEFAEPPPASVVAPAPAAHAAAPSDDSELATLEQAEAALERARADLDRLALLEPPRASTSDEASPAAQSRPSPPPAPATPAAKRAASSAGRAADRDLDRDEKKGSGVGRARASAPKAEAEAPGAPAEGKSDNPCETGCKAFASLLRAKSAVCRLDAPGGSRCSRAEDIAREAQSRVRSCGCQQ